MHARLWLVVGVSQLSQGRLATDAAHRSGPSHPNPVLHSRSPRWPLSSAIPPSNTQLKHHSLAQQYLFNELGGPPIVSFLTVFGFERPQTVDAP